MTNKNEKIELINALTGSVNEHVEATIERANLMIDIARATNDSNLSTQLLDKAEISLLKVLSPLKDEMDYVELTDQEIDQINERIEISQGLLEFAKSLNNRQEIINKLGPIVIEMLLGNKK